MKKSLDFIKKTCDKASLALTTASTMAMVAMNDIACAAADGGELLQKILELLASLLIPFGVILGIMGIVHFASAKSEGDGPASNKAIGQIAAGVMLVVLSVLIKSQAGDFASMLSS